jgi:predicted alternative tryptophan synthase beta-subunit
MEIPASYAYDYTDRKGFTPLLKMHTLGHSFALNAHDYFALSTYDALLVGKLKDFAYSEEKVEEAITELPKISSW